MTTEHEPSIDPGGDPTGDPTGDPGGDPADARDLEMVLPPAAAELADQIRAGGRPDDELFDRFLPLRLRLASGVFWTPLVVAARAAAWFAELGITSVVDIGSGAGKFCVAAALGGTCRFTGIEQRPRLVTAAERLARLFQVDDRVRFIAGALDPGNVPPADAYYLYNPFAENRFGPEDHLDEDVELGEARYQQDLAAVDDLLRRARRGTYVVTYNGFGGHVPEHYEKVRVDRTLPNMLRMWRKSS